MNDILVSVIIPVYNVEPYLNECINSVIFQSYHNLEILLIDDGSDDGSERICDDAAGKDTRIKVFHQVNKGLSAARNVGLEHAKGDIIAFLDSDDAFHKDMIRIMTDEMLKQSVDIVVCGFSVYDTDGKMISEKSENAEIHSRVMENTEVLNILIDREIDATPWNKVYKRNIWNDLRFPEGHVYEGTYTVYDIFYKAGRVAIMDEELIMHRDRAGSICNTLSLNNIHDLDSALEHCFQFARDHMPDIFTYDQLGEINATRIRARITSYFQYVMHYPDDIEEANVLRKELKEIVDEYGLESCSFRIKIGYYLSIYVPKTTAFILRLFSGDR